MRVLKAGVVPQCGQVLRGECKNCGCVVEVSEDEAGVDCLVRCPTGRCKASIQVFPGGQS